MRRYSPEPARWSRFHPAPGIKIALSLFMVRSAKMTRHLALAATILAVFGCGGAIESPNVDTATNTASIDTLGKGPKKGDLLHGKSSDCSRELSSDFLECRSCADAGPQPPICDCYACERASDRCTLAYCCPTHH